MMIKKLISFQLELKCSFLENFNTLKNFLAEY